MSMLSMFGACSKLWVSGNMNGVSTSPEIANSGKERVKRRSARWNEWARWVYSAIYGGLRQVRSGVASDKEAFGLKTWYDDIIMRSSLPIKKRWKRLKTSESAHPIDDQQFAANILTRTTGEEDRRAGKVFWVTPATRWDPLRNLSKPHRIS